MHVTRLISHVTETNNTWETRLLLSARLERFVTTTFCSIARMPFRKAALLPEGRATILKKAIAIRHVANKPQFASAILWTLPNKRVELEVCLAGSRIPQLPSLFQWAECVAHWDLDDQGSH